MTTATDTQHAVEDTTANDPKLDDLTSHTLELLSESYAKTDEDGVERQSLIARMALCIYLLLVGYVPDRRHDVTLERIVRTQRNLNNSSDDPTHHGLTQELDKLREKLNPNTNSDEQTPLKQCAGGCGYTLLAHLDYCPVCVESHHD
jgi:hypothetical protein